MTTGRTTMSMEARAGYVLAHVAAMPAALQSVFRSGLYDMLTHHRTSVLKHHKFPGGRRAQQMLASRTFRYTKPDPNAGPAGVTGEAWAAAEVGQTYGEGAFELWESGGRVMSRGRMIVPVGEGREMVRTVAGRRRFSALIRERKLQPSGPYLFRKARGKSPRALIAKWTDRREQPAVLGWRRQFDSVAARHLPKFERLMDRAIKAGGDAALLEEQRISGLGRQAYKAEFTRIWNENQGLHGNKRRGLATRAAKLAQKAAERDAVSGTGEGSE